MAVRVILLEILIETSRHDNWNETSKETVRVLSWLNFFALSSLMEILLTLLGLGGIFWGWVGLWSSKLHEFLSSLRAGPKGCALRVLGLLLADGALTVRKGKTF